MRITKKLFIALVISQVAVTQAYANEIVSSKDQVYGIIFSDPQGNKGNLDAKIQECQTLAKSVENDPQQTGPVNGSGVRGAARGAAAGAAVGAISGNSGSDGAKIGAAVGLVGGRLSRNAELNAQKNHSDQQQKQVMRNCMIERGFNALN